MLNLAFVGSSDAHMTRLVTQLLARIPAVPRGFHTRKLPPDGEGREYTYLHPIGEPERCTEENWIGICCRRRAEKRPEAFDGYARDLLAQIPPGSLVVMDQLGTMESRALAFQRQVLSMLDGRYAVLASIRDKDTPFLQALRTHPGFLIVPAEAADTPQARQSMSRFVSQFAGNSTDQPEKSCNFSDSPV